MLRALLLVLALVIATPANAVNPVRTAAAASVQIGDYCSATVILPGVAVTAAHCDAPFPEQFVWQNGKRLRIEKWTYDSKGRDLAFVLVPGLECPCVPLGDGNDVKRGAPVVMIGFPDGGPQQITNGAIRFENRLEPVQNDDGSITFYNVIVIDKPVRGGHSGGGLFVIRDSVAYLIGVVVIADDKTSGAVDLTR